MPFLRTLVREVARKAAQDPRVRDAAKRLGRYVLKAAFEKVVKPRAKEAWQKARPEVETAWERAKPEIKAAKDRAVKKAGKMASRVKPQRQGIAGQLQAAAAEPPTRGSQSIVASTADSKTT